MKCNPVLSYFIAQSFPELAIVNSFTGLLSLWHIPSLFMCVFQHFLADDDPRSHCVFPAAVLESVIFPGAPVPWLEVVSVTYVCVQDVLVSTEVSLLEGLLKCQNKGTGMLTLVYITGYKYFCVQWCIYYTKHELMLVTPHGPYSFIPLLLVIFHSLSEKPKLYHLTSTYHFSSSS